MTKEEISNLIFRNWTEDPKSGFTTPEVPTISDSAKEKIKATCDAIADAIFQDVQEGLVAGTPLWKTDVWLAAGGSGPFALSFTPVEGSILAHINLGMLAEGVDYTVNENIITFIGGVSLAGSDQLTVRYQTPAPPPA